MFLSGEQRTLLFGMATTSIPEQGIDLGLIDDPADVSGVVGDSTVNSVQPAATTTPEEGTDPRVLDDPADASDVVSGSVVSSAGPDGNGEGSSRLETREIIESVHGFRGPESGRPPTEDELGDDLRPEWQFWRAEDGGGNIVRELVSEKPYDDSFALDPEYQLSDPSFDPEALEGESGDDSVTGPANSGTPGRLLAGHAFGDDSDTSSIASASDAGPLFVSDLDAGYTSETAEDDAFDPPPQQISAGVVVVPSSVDGETPEAAQAARRPNPLRPAR